MGPTCMLLLDKPLTNELILATGLFGDLENSSKPSISDILDFGFLRNLNVDSFLIAGSNANQVLKRNVKPDYEL